MAGSDLLSLPSYREGFGSVIVEAAAVGIPAIASRIYGLTDAVCDGETGLLHEPGNVEQIRQLLQRLVADSGLREAMGAKAMARAVTSFDQAVVANAMIGYYREHLT